MKYSKRQLQRMKKDELTQIAAKLDCEIKPGMKKPEILELVLNADGQGGTAAQTTERQPGNKKQFDLLTQPTTAEPPVPDSTPLGPGSGGARANAGRKPGVTLEQSKIDNLPTTSNRSIKDGLKWLFRGWAKIADCELIKLDDDELEELAVDATQFCEYHGFKIPQGLSIDGRFALNVIDKVGGRVAIKNAHKARMDKQAKKEKQNEK